MSLIVLSNFLNPVKHAAVMPFRSQSKSVLDIGGVLGKWLKKCKNIPRIHLTHPVEKLLTGII